MSTTPLPQTGKAVSSRRLATPQEKNLQSTRQKEGRHQFLQMPRKPAPERATHVGRGERESSHEPLENQAPLCSGIAPETAPDDKGMFRQAGGGGAAALAAA